MKGFSFQAFFGFKMDCYNFTAEKTILKQTILFNFCFLPIIRSDLNRRNLYIAIFLQVIFLTPLVYQNYHIFKHHFHTVCIHVEKHDNAIKHSFENHAKNDEACIICNYEFSIFTSPEGFNFSTPKLPVILNITEIVLKGYPGIFNQKISPRAPPINA